MEEKKTFNDLAGSIASALRAGDDMLESLKKEVGDLEKKRSEAESGLKRARESYDEKVGQSSAYMVEFETKKKAEHIELVKMRKEAEESLKHANMDRIQMEKLLQEAKRKDDSASGKLAEADKIKVELELRRERAKELAQSI